MLRHKPQWTLELIEKTCLWVLSWVSRDPHGNRHTEVHLRSQWTGYLQGYDEGVAEGREEERDRWHRMMAA